MRRWFWIFVQIGVFIGCAWPFLPPYEVIPDPVARAKASHEVGVAIFIGAVATYTFATLCLYVPVWVSRLRGSRVQQSTDDRFRT
jgi:hypothetical protein